MMNQEVIEELHPRNELPVYAVQAFERVIEDAFSWCYRMDTYETVSEAKEAARWYARHKHIRTRVVKLQWVGQDE